MFYWPEYEYKKGGKKCITYFSVKKNLKGKEYLGDLDVDARIILKYIIMKKCVDWIQLI
jgi:hypothetical protein